MQIVGIVGELFHRQAECLRIQLLRRAGIFDNRPKPAQNNTFNSFELLIAPSNQCSFHSRSFLRAVLNKSDTTHQLSERLRRRVVGSWVLNETLEPNPARLTLMQLLFDCMVRQRNSLSSCEAAGLGSEHRLPCRSIVRRNERDFRMPHMKCRRHFTRLLLQPVHLLARSPRNSSSGKGFWHHSLFILQGVMHATS